MKRKFISFLSLIALLGFALPANALRVQLVGGLSGTEPDTLIYGPRKNVHPTLSRVVGTAIDDIHTTVTTDGGVEEYNGWLYFTNSTGFWKQKKGTSSGVKIKSGSKLSLVAMSNEQAVVSDASKNGQSFLYLASSRHKTMFSPVIKEITSASITQRGGGKIAMIAKNSAGKQRLFLSDSSLTVLTELPLPRYATKCDGIAMSPQNTTLFISCRFKLPNQTSSVHGYVLAQIGRTNIKSSIRIINNLSYFDAEWVTNSTLATIEVTNDNLSSLVIRKLSKGKITNTSTISTDVPFTYGGRSAVLTPYDMEADDAGTGFYYVLITQFTDASSPFAGPTVLGFYNIRTNESTLISDDGTFKYLPN